MKLYISYQASGGEDEWVVTQADAVLDEIRPAFTTVLACDKIITKGVDKDIVAAAKYFGPMYFDLDCEADVGAAIRDAKALVAKLKTAGLTDDDMELYLSGKKGIHLLIPAKVFMEKPAPVSRLHVIYKELAFKFAVPSTDFQVYSGRSGRMFRTCYRQRENGNWKVRLTAQELETLDETGYHDLCSRPSRNWPSNPTYRAGFAITYEALHQKVAAQKKIKSKPVDSATLARHTPVVRQVMSGVGLKPDLGFNKVAIQLALYAHEVKLTADQFVDQCQGLVTKHQSDGFRYNSARKRELELRRMYDYLEEGVGYEYAIGPIQAMLAPKDEWAEDEESATPEEAYEELPDMSGLFLKGANYFVSTEQGDKHIMDAKFVDVVVLQDGATEQISSIVGSIQVGSKVSPISLERSDFVSSTGLHKAVSLYGASFTGTDVHARYIFTHMLRQSTKDGKVVYATSREGLDVLRMPMSELPVARTPFIVWSDGSGVRLPPPQRDAGLDVRFVGYPSPEGVMRTDLAKAPPIAEWAKTAGNLDKLREMLRGLLTCQDVNSVSKLVGWMSACFYSQMFRAAYGKFPLLHINGAAGSGKSEMTDHMMSMFYWNAEVPVLSPGSTTFAIESAIAASASIPVVVDEYKPAEMIPMQHSKLKSLFRSSYNGHTVSRGGGSRQKDSFGALNQIQLAGPVVFIAEAIEQETALLERCVVLTLRRPFGLLGLKYRGSYTKFVDNKEALSIVGSVMAAEIVSNYSVEKFRKEFDSLYSNARSAFLLQPGDMENLDQDTLNRKMQGRERVVYGHSVAAFGLVKFESLIRRMVPDMAEELDQIMEPFFEGVFNRMSEMSSHTVAEYIKVLITISDMTRFPSGDPLKLEHGRDFEFESVGGQDQLNLVTRLVFNKYRQYQRTLGAAPLFQGDGSFAHALRDSSLFISDGEGTKHLRQESIRLDAEAMVRLGVPSFQRGK